MKRLLEYIEGNKKIAAFVRENKDMLVKAAAVAIMVIVAFLIFAFKDDGKEEKVMIEDSVAAEETSIAKVYVDIGGEVKNPMVAELDEGCRVEDAIEAAGGLTENADTTEINRAAFIEDGDKIFIPPLAEAGEYDTDGSQTPYVYSDGKVNINTADSEELQELNGVGPATAEKIISYRQENGRFDSIEDIKNVSGIGDKTFEKFKDKIKT